MRFRRKSNRITVGDRALEDLHVRAATEPGRAVVAESRDWLLVKSVMMPGERQRARVAVRFPQAGNAAGFAFVTDQRIIFEVRERVTAVALAYVVFAGRPSDPRLGDFVVTARTSESLSGGEHTTVMRVRDVDAFHDFFPTLLDAARGMGAQPEVDTSWGGQEQRPPVSRRVETAEPLPTDVLDRALARFMHDDERIAFAAEMVCRDGGGVTVLVTQRRLVVVESRLIWATPLRRTRVAEAGGTALEVWLLAEVVTESLVLGGGLASVGSGQRRLTLRSETDPAAGVQLHAQLRAGGARPL